MIASVNMQSFGTVLGGRSLTDSFRVMYSIWVSNYSSWKKKRKHMYSLLLGRCLHG